MSQYNIAIISGHYPGSAFSSKENHRIYADLHGYKYINCNWPTKAKNPYFNKMYYIKEYIECFDALFWIDDDAFFWDLDRKICDYYPQGECFFSACKSPSYKEIFTVFSSGQFFIKNTQKSIDFINETIETDLAEVKKWWQESYGYFSNGDQDAMLFHLYKKSSEEYQLYDYKEFNSRFENLFSTEPHKPLILHFTGKKDIKHSNYHQVQKEFNLSEFLIEPKLLVEYGIKPKSRKKKKKSLLSKIIKAVS
jgi:hypothetical protein